MGLSKDFKSSVHLKLSVFSAGQLQLASEAPVAGNIISVKVFCPQQLLATWHLEADHDVHLLHQ